MRIERGYTDRGTFGRWYSDNGEFICLSMERPWVDNLPYESCIPEGDYLVEPHNSPKFGAVFILSNTKCGVGRYKGENQRYSILIHPANRPSELRGCIAPGSTFHQWDSEWGVNGSQVALNKLEPFLEKERILRIVARRAIWSVS